MKISRLRQPLIALLLISLGAGCDATSSQNREHRIHSTTGFSFSPPASNTWIEEARHGEIIYSPKTDPLKVTFFMGAMEIDSPLALDYDSLMDFATHQENHWGNDGRYIQTMEEFQRETEHPLCVRYRFYAHDTQAKSKANQLHMILNSEGRICRHPNNPHALVNIYYSVRHAPDFNPDELISEGEALISSLRFEKIQKQAQPQP